MGLHHKELFDWVRQRGTGALGAKPHSPIRRQGFLSHGDNITDGGGL